MAEQTIAGPLMLTYEDYCALPDDRMRYEILNGDLFLSPAPQTQHQRVLLRLLRILAEYVEQNNLGEVFVAPFDVLLAKHDIVEPDLIYVAAANSAIVTDKHIRGVPDLLVEIVSPSRPEYDIRQKRAVYARCGVPWYWIVEPKHRRVTELRLIQDAYEIESKPAGTASFTPALFPELKVPLRRLWGSA